MIDVTTTGMAFLTALGLPEVLLWVLTFAVVFGILTKLGIFKGKASAALISIVVGFMVLLAVPTSLIAVIASMSTSLLTVAIGFIVLLALIEVAGAHPLINVGTRDKPDYRPVHPFQKHGTITAILLIGISIAIFFLSGGWALVGFGALPAISGATWILVIVGGAVLWMLSEKEA